jgi:molybdate transport system substrate-binding protein
MVLSRRSVLGFLPLPRAPAARAQSASVQIYAAMIFRPALDHVILAYRDAGGAATAVYGPKPLLVRQLEVGAPADILFTADPDWMDVAEHKSLIQAGTRSNFLSNTLVLAGATDVWPVGEITKRFALEDVLRGGRLAMCDPANDPAGRYAKQSLQALGLWEMVASPIAIAESAPGAVVMVERGEVGAAVCFATDLHGAAHVALIGVFPAGSHAPIVYPVALAAHAPDPRAGGASDFFGFRLWDGVSNVLPRPEDDERAKNFSLHPRRRRMAPDPDARPIRRDARARHRGPRQLRAAI